MSSVISTFGLPEDILAYIVMPYLPDDDNADDVSFLLLLPLFSPNKQKKVVQNLVNSTWVFDPQDLEAFVQVWHRCCELRQKQLPTTPTMLLTAVQEKLLPVVSSLMEKNEDDLKRRVLWEDFSRKMYAMAVHGPLSLVKYFVEKSENKTAMWALMIEFLFDIM